ncbi:hypothetical protein V8C37DRAFT_364446 [Trichoderma ceciliae]
MLSCSGWGNQGRLIASKGGQARKNLAHQRLLVFLGVIVILELPLLARTGCQNAPQTERSRISPTSICCVCCKGKAYHLPVVVMIVGSRKGPSSLLRYLGNLGTKVLLILLYWVLP